MKRGRDIGISSDSDGEDSLSEVVDLPEFLFGQDEGQGLAPPLESSPVPSPLGLLPGPVTQSPSVAPTGPPHQGSVPDPNLEVAQEGSSSDPPRHEKVGRCWEAYVTSPQRALPVLGAVLRPRVSIPSSGMVTCTGYGGPQFAPLLSLTAPIRLEPAAFITSALSELMVAHLDLHYATRAGNTGIFPAEYNFMFDGALALVGQSDLGTTAREQVHQASRVWMERCCAALQMHGEDKVGALLAALTVCSSSDPEGDWRRAFFDALVRRGTLAVPELIASIRDRIPVGFWVARPTVPPVEAGAGFWPNFATLSQYIVPRIHTPFVTSGTWLTGSIAPVLILGDQDLLRLPPIFDQRVMIHLFPGAGLVHALGVIEGLETPREDVNRVLLAFGHGPFRTQSHEWTEATVAKVFSVTHARFPQARVLFALRPLGVGMSREVASLVNVLNLYMGLRPCIPPLDMDLVTFDPDGHTWSPGMGAAMWDLWAKYLF